jgi:hypothetical protein
MKQKSPNPQDLQFLQTWMQTPSMGNVYLLGSDSDIWEKPDLGDLISLKRRETHSPISRFLSDSLIRWYHHLLGHFLRVSTIHQARVLIGCAHFMVETGRYSVACQHSTVLSGHPTVSQYFDRYRSCISSPRCLDDRIVLCSEHEIAPCSYRHIHGHLLCCLRNLYEWAYHRDFLRNCNVSQSSPCQSRSFQSLLT